MFDFIFQFIVLILVVVFIHEYGHYYFAKKYGVGITDFSIGFGKEIFGWKDKSGTRWKVCWIPLGGYVKFFGDRNVFSQSEQQETINQYKEEDRQKLFILKPLYQRSIIVAAGPLANFVLAIIIFSIINMFVGKDFTPAVVNEVLVDSPAYKAGLKMNDVIVEFNGQIINNSRKLPKEVVYTTSGEEVSIKLVREGKAKTVVVILQPFPEHMMS